ncbi:MAG: ferritin-like domain-containing protein [Phycisphaerales bacterium]
MKIETLTGLYIDMLQDMHSSERQIIKALPKMSKAAAHADLKTAFNKHLDETKEHLERIVQLLEGLDKGPGRKVCEATAGLVRESAELIEATDDEQVRDAGLICAAQKVEHYEIASYGCLRTFATLLGRHADAKLLDRTLNEERKTDESLTALAMSVVNAEAMAGSPAGNPPLAR